MRSMIIRIVNCFQTLLMFFFRLFPIQKKKVFFQSYFGKYYNDNPMMISQELEKANLGFTQVWLADGKIDCPKGIKTVTPHSVRYYYELATAKVWVDNCRKRGWVRKRKDQYYIQTWHGNLGNKRAEGAAIETLSKEYVKRSQKDAAMTDLMISGSTFFTNLIRQYFWYNGEILKCGTPRLDGFINFDQEKKNGIKNRMGIGIDKKVVLYAPTFRESLDTACYNMDFQRMLNAFEKKTGDSWVVLVRLHPNVTDKADFIQYSDRIINATGYPDLYELIPMVDVVISDYSSLTFEAGLLQKPVFLYTLDLEEYIRERGFYIDIHDQPYILAQNDNELEKVILEFDREAYLTELNRFNDALGIQENGTAAKQIVEKIIEVTGMD